MKRLIEVDEPAFSKLKDQSAQSGLTMKDIASHLVVEQENNPVNLADSVVNRSVKSVNLEPDELCSDCQEKVKSKLMENVKVTVVPEGSTGHWGWLVIGLLALAYLNKPVNQASQDGNQP